MGSNTGLEDDPDRCWTLQLLQPERAKGLPGVDAGGGPGGSCCNRPFGRFRLTHLIESSGSRSGGRPPVAADKKGDKRMGVGQAGQSATCAAMVKAGAR